MNPRNNVATKSPYDLVTHIDRLDPYTIVVHLKQPYAPFIAAFFSMGPTPYPVLPKHLLAGLSDLNQAAYNNMPIGTGPFKIVQYEKARFIKFEANPQYWRGPPKLKEILVTFIPDENTIVTQLRTHELDMERAADPGYVPTFQTIPGVKVHVTPFTSYAQMALNMNNPILADRTVRQALAYAIDKQAIINKAAHGVPSVANSDQPQFLWAYNPNVRVYQYNPVLARQMLDADGWKVGPDGWRYKNGQRLSLQFVSNTGGGIAEAIAEIAQRQWHDIGAQVEIKDYPASLLFATYGAGGIFQTGKFDIGFLGWANGVDPDDSTEFMCDQMPPAGQNLYHFCNRDLDAAERISLTSNSPSVRKAAYDKIQAILADEEPTIFVWFTNRVSVVNTDLKNYKPAHAVTTMWNPWEWEI
jgi:peptide/nickel transport system substrate-binding protein